MADGCVTNGGRRVQLQLAERDKPHIEAFREFLGSEHMIRLTICKSPKTKFPSRQNIFAFTSAPVVADLARYGVVPRKSFTAESIGLELNRDFWRGVVDGNGCLSYCPDRRGKLNPSVSLAGSMPLMQQFATFADIHAVGRPVNVRPAKKIFVVSVSHSRAVKLARVLYDGAETALERKRALATGMYSP